MARLIVSATASPTFDNFIMLVSVSSTDGKATKGLKPGHFKIHHLSSLNHASVLERVVTKANEGPDGFYTLLLAPWEPQPNLPPGHYVFAVAVSWTPRRGAETNHGQCVAVGDMPK